MEIINHYRKALPYTGEMGDAEVAQVDVLTQDEAGQYAVYRMITPLWDDQPDEPLLWHIAYKGHKQPWRSAICSFPNIPEEAYRH